MQKRAVVGCHLLAIISFFFIGGCGDDPVCGDGVLAGRETCDDGNLDTGDGCGATCFVEQGWTCTEGAGCEGICGDYVLVDDEVCEPGLSAPEYCSADCSMVTGACGDSLLQTDYEECDDGNLASYDGCSGQCGEDYGFTCSGTPSVCDASSVPGDLTGASLDSTQRTELCSWFIRTLGGAGRSINCGTWIYEVNTVSGCAGQIGGSLGACTVEDMERWVAARGNACDTLESTIPFC